MRSCSKKLKENGHLDLHRRANIYQRRRCRSRKHRRLKRRLGSSVSAELPPQQAAGRFKIRSERLSSNLESADAVDHITQRSDFLYCHRSVFLVPLRRAACPHRGGAGEFRPSRCDPRLRGSGSCQIVRACHDSQIPGRGITNAPSRAPPILFQPAHKAK